MKRYLLLIMLLLLTGCTVGPDYHKPAITVPVAFKEAPGWKQAEPGDESPRGKWWEIYADAELNTLMSQIEISNQNVAAAAAQYRQVQALLGVAQASNLPTIAGSVSATRAQGASSSSSATASPAKNSLRPALSASWEADIWGHIGRNIEANQASVQASKADLQSALLSAQGTLVQAYFQLRVNDAAKKLLAQTLAAYQRSLEITQNRYQAGIAGRVDVAQAETQLKTTQVQIVDLEIQRAALEHAIAVLTGQVPANLQIKLNNTLPELPAVPATLPSALLERRPDIAGAERRMAAANAQIGVAQAAYYPALTLNTTAGFQSSSLSQLFSLPNRFWSLGPTFAMTLFDAGARTAQKEAAVATYDKSVAAYRQTVLASFQEVEDNLATLRLLAEEAALQQEAMNYASEARALTENQYKAGTVGYLNVITAQATELGAKRNSLDIAGRRLVANATLFKALGGNWQVK
jgi:NodT family efflux transporter outer membrane factor (OMF) lipoprotein